MHERRAQIRWAILWLVITLSLLAAGFVFDGSLFVLSAFIAMVFCFVAAKLLWPILAARILPDANSTVKKRRRLANNKIIYWRFIDSPIESASALETKFRAYLANFGNVETLSAFQQTSDLPHADEAILIVLAFTSQYQDYEHAAKIVGQLKSPNLLVLFDQSKTRSRERKQHFTKFRSAFRREFQLPSNSFESPIFRIHPDGRADELIERSNVRKLINQFVFGDDIARHPLNRFMNDVGFEIRKTKWMARSLFVITKSFLLFVLAAIFSIPVGSISYVILHDTGLVDNENLRLAISFLIPVCLIGCAVLVLFLVWCGKRRRNMMSTDVFDLQQTLNTPVVLYLRSFGDEEFVLGVDYFEGALVDLFQGIGRLICIGRPGEFVRGYGAARSYVADEYWVQQISDWIDESDLIVIRAGETNGLLKEVGMIRSIADPNRILVLFDGEGEERLKIFKRFKTLCCGQIEFPATFDYCPIYQVDNNWKATPIKSKLGLRDRIEIFTNEYTQRILTQHINKVGLAVPIKNVKSATSFWLGVGWSFLLAILFCGGCPTIGLMANASDAEARQKASSLIGIIWVIVGVVAVVVFLVFALHPKPWQFASIRTKQSTDNKTTP